MKHFLYTKLVNMRTRLSFEKDDKIRKRYEKYLQDQQQTNNDIPTSNTNKTSKTTDSTDLLEHKER